MYSQLGQFGRCPRASWWSVGEEGRPPWRAKKDGIKLTEAIAEQLEIDLAEFAKGFAHAALTEEITG